MAPPKVGAIVRRMGLVWVVLISSLAAWAAAAQVRGAPNLFWKVGSVPAKYFTIAPDISVVGPVFKDGEDAEYVRTLFTKILRDADAIARKRYFDPKRERNDLYFSFLLAAIAVPHHESHLTHFRQALGRDCDPELNELKAARMSDGVRRRVMDSFRGKSENDVIFPNCDMLGRNESVVQVMMSEATWADIGLWQINAVHREALEPDYVLNIFRANDKGLNILFEHFQRINAQRLSYRQDCMAKPYFENLVRGSFAAYNDGNTSEAIVCRRFNSANPRSAHDEDFLKSVRSIASWGNSIYGTYLPEGSVEYQALKELVRNFAIANGQIAGVQKYDNLQEILDSNSAPIKNDVIYPRRVQGDANFYLKDGRIALWLAPARGAQLICGELVNDNTSGQRPQIYVDQIHLVPRVGGGEKEGWARVQVSRFNRNFAPVSQGVRNPACDGAKYYYVPADQLMAVRGKPARILPERETKLGVALRSGPSSNSAIAGYLKSSDQVQIVSYRDDEKAGHWFEVVTSVNPQRKFWVESRFLESL